MTDIFKHAKLNTWQSLSIPLSCFTAAGGDLMNVEAPFAIETSGRFALTVSDVSLSRDAAGPASRCP
jgi:beta-glucosidase